MKRGRNNTEIFGPNKKYRDIPSLLERCKSNVTKLMWRPLVSPANVNLSELYDDCFVICSSDTSNNWDGIGSSLYGYLFVNTHKWVKEFYNRPLNVRTLYYGLDDQTQGEIKSLLLMKKRGLLSRDMMNFIMDYLKPRIELEKTRYTICKSHLNMVINRFAYVDRFFIPRVQKQIVLGLEKTFPWLHPLRLLYSKRKFCSIKDIVDIVLFILHPEVFELCPPLPLSVQVFWDL